MLKNKNQTKTTKPKHQNRTFPTGATTMNFMSSKSQGFMSALQNGELKADRSR